MKFQGKGSCSGFLLNDRSFVTAAHCIKKSSAVADYKVTILTDLDSGSVSEDLAVASMLAFPHRAAENHSGFFPFGDVAVLTLSRAYADFRSFPLLTDTESLENGLEVMIAGFGSLGVAGPQPSRSKLQFGLTQLIQYHPYGRFQSELHLDGGEEKTAACFGDSGGPAYANIQGQWQIIATTHGVNNFAFPELAGGNTCLQGKSIYVALADAVSWFQQLGLLPSDVIVTKRDRLPSRQDNAYAFCEDEHLTIEDIFTLHTLMRQTGAITCSEIAEKAANARQLSLRDKGLISSKALRFWNQIERLDYRGNIELDAQDLAGMSRLKDLQAPGVELHHASNLSELRELTKLNLRGVKLSKREAIPLDILRSMPSLVELDLAETGISRFPSLLNSQLQLLDLTGNEMQSLENLSVLGDLKELYLARNRIADVHGIEDLIELETLTLSDNLIQDPKPLHKLQRLTFLSLNGNRIPADQQICPIEEEFDGAICSFQ
jgi:hypothetical protein